MWGAVWCFVERGESIEFLTFWRWTGDIPKWHDEGSEPSMRACAGIELGSIAILFVRITLKGRQKANLFDSVISENPSYNLQEENILLRQLRKALEILHRTIDDVRKPRPANCSNSFHPILILFSTNDFRFQLWRLGVVHQVSSHMFVGQPPSFLRAYTS